MIRIFRLLVFSLALMALTSHKGHSQSYAVKVDVLGAATTTFSIEGAMALNYKWSLHLPVRYNPWVYSGNKKIQHLSASPGVRYWVVESFGRGIYIGMNTVAAWYNFGGFLSDYRREGYAFGAGVSVGYSIPIAKRWNIEFEGGVAGVWTKYDKYECVKCGDMIYKNRTALRVVPNNVAIGITYLF